MDNSSILHSELERAWASACRILFGREIGELKKYRNYLLELNEPLVHHKSSLSKEEVTYPEGLYCENAKWASHKEIFGKKFPSLGINDIKDMDSLIEAVQERIYYSGNLMLGEAEFFEKTTNCRECFYMLESDSSVSCKYVAFSSWIRGSDYVFGCNGSGRSTYVVRCNKGLLNSRCLEEWKCGSCSDCYYVHGLQNCGNCIFCFNIKNANYAIGNLKLPKEKYLKLKEKLVSEFADELEKKKTLPSLIEIVRKSRRYADERLLKSVCESSPPEPATNKKTIEDSFEATTAIILGKSLRNMDSYSKWLSRDVRPMEQGKSAISGKPLSIPHYCNIEHYPRDRLLKQAEAELLGEKTSLTPQEAEGLTLGNVQERIGRIAYLSPEFLVGNHLNIIDCPTAWLSSMHNYKCCILVESKYCAYTCWPLNSERTFGSNLAFDSSFCLKCYYSKSLARCFEVDSSLHCADSYYCHNCENVRSGILCFNAYNLNYAVGNTEVGKEKYLKTKEMLLEWLNETLEKTKDVPLSIYNVGCWKR